jgi:hypothetical protein
LINIGDVWDLINIGDVWDLINIGDVADPFVNPQSDKSA